MKKPTEYAFTSYCYNIGFRFYEDGVIRNKDGSKAGFYLKGDFLTDEQKGKLVEKFGNWVAILKAQSQYAPESVKPVVMLKSQKEFSKA
jgi:hypothetical protein